MRVRRSLLNFGTSALFLAVTMAVALKSSPLLVAWLGAKRYGGYRVVADGYGYLTLLELGLGGALGPLLARALGRGDERALYETVAAGARAYARVAASSVAVGLLLTPFVSWFARDLAGDEVTDLRLGWVVGLTAILSLSVLPLRALVEARQLGYAVNLLLTAQSLLITGLSLVLARAGWGITGQAVAQASGVWACSLALGAVVLRAHPGLFRAALAAPAGPEARRALRDLSVPSLMINVCGRVGLLADNLVVGGLLGTARVTSLVNTQRLVQAGQGVLQAVGGASWAALAELHARRDLDTFNRRLVEMTRLVALLAASGLAPVVAFNRAFVRLWMGPDFPYGGDAVTAVAAVNALLLAEQSLWAWGFTATGKARDLLAPAVASAAVNLASSVVLTHYYGLVGPLLGTTLGLAAVGLWALPLRLRQAFGTPVGALAKALVLPAAWGVAVASGLHGMGRWYEPRGWGSLLALEGLAALAALAVGAAALLTSEERALWRGRLRALRPVGRPEP